MKLNKHLECGVLLWALATVALGATVQNLNAQGGGPPGGLVHSIAIDPSNPATLYAGAGNGVFKSTNGATSWFAVNSGLPAWQFDALAIDPSTPATLYAGAFVFGVFKSIDGGTSWSAVNSGFTTFNINVYALAIDPSTPATLYAGTENGVYKSTNGGTSWSALRPLFRPHLRSGY